MTDDGSRLDIPDKNRRKVVDFEKRIKFDRTAVRKERDEVQKSKVSNTGPHSSGPASLFIPSRESVAWNLGAGL